MKTINNRLALQHGYQQLLQPYEPHFQFALTLTLKQGAKIITPINDYSDRVYERWVRLNEETFDSTMRRFNARLTHYLYGNQSKHKNKQAWAKPMLIIAIEGQNSAKRTHVHAALGNVPVQHLHCVDKLVAQAWADCDFGYRQKNIKEITSAFGWNEYITKEVGYVNDDAISVTHMYIPKIISQRICTESRLRFA